MKKLTIFILCCLSTACKPDEPTLFPALPPLLYIVVNDISTSADYFKLEKATFLNTIMQHEDREIIQIAGLCISGASDNQLPYLSTILERSAQAPQGSLYEIGATIKKNQKKDSLFQENLKVSVDSLFSTINRPRIEQYTDVDGALHLVNRFVRQPKFDRYEIRLIIFSDLEQRLKHSTSMQTHTFPGNVTIYTIGKSEEVSLSEVFPENRYYDLLAFNPQFFHP